MRLPPLHAKEDAEPAKIYAKPKNRSSNWHFFWPLDGLYEYHFISDYKYGAKMTWYNKVFQKSIITFSIDALAKTDRSERVQLEKEWNWRNLLWFYFNLLNLKVKLNISSSNFKHCFSKSQFTFIKSTSSKFDVSDSLRKSNIIITGLLTRIETNHTQIHKDKAIRQ